MFNQNGNLKISISFLSLENNSEYACLKPTLNRKLAYAILSEEHDLNQNKLLSSIGKKYLNYIYFSDPGPKNSRFFLSLEDDIEHI